MSEIVRIYYGNKAIPEPVNQNMTFGDAILDCLSAQQETIKLLVHHLKMIEQDLKILKERL